MLSLNSPDPLKHSRSATCSPYPAASASSSASSSIACAKNTKVGNESRRRSSQFTCAEGFVLLFVQDSSSNKMHVVHLVRIFISQSKTFCCLHLCHVIGKLELKTYLGVQKFAPPFVAFLCQRDKQLVTRDVAIKG